MRILYSAIASLLLISCTKKEIFVPQSDVSLVTEITDFTPVSMLFETSKDGEINIDVKNKGLITQTHWIFEIDKRLPLKLVIPEVEKLQAKKRKNAEAKMLDNYFTYMDTLHKKVAYMPFTVVSFAKNNSELEQNAQPLNLKITREGEVKVGDEVLNLLTINDYLNQKYKEQQLTIYLEFDENLSFEKYLQTKLNLAKINVPNVRISTIEVVY